MSWGISESATDKEKFWADINDCLKGYNSNGKIDYGTYIEMYDDLRNVFNLHIKEKEQ